MYNCSLERWDDLYGFSDECRRQMAPIASAAAWAMKQWTIMDRYTNFIPKETQEGAFYRAVLAIHKNQFSVAQEVMALLGFNYFALNVIT